MLLPWEVFSFLITAIIVISGEILSFPITAIASVPRFTDT